jgi:hypothetical protein
MRRPLRNVEIFSMSVLDMFASALGAFIMITAILFPYYNQAQQLKQVVDQTEQVTSEIVKVEDLVRKDEETSRQQQKEISAAGEIAAATDACHDSIARCKAALTSTFLVIGIEWSERADLDLYITDPFKNEFSYSNKTAGRAKNPKSQAQLSLDMTDGPGIEIWQDPSAAPGPYTIAIDVFSASSATVMAQAWIIDRSGGRRPIPIRPLTQTDRRLPIASLRVNTDGSTTIAPAR